MAKWKKPAKKYAPNDEKFNRLLRACNKTKQPLENKFLILVLGILGLRAGELAHLKEKWIDFDRKEIIIPLHEPCDCKYCTDKMKKQLKKNVSSHEVMKEYWHPKTVGGVRTVYFGFNEELEEILKEMMDKYHKCPYTPIAITHRVRRLGEQIDIKVYPHSLRSRAASKFSNDGMSLGALQNIMGWKNTEMAEHYIRSSGRMARKELGKLYEKEQKHSNNYLSRRKFYLTHLGKKLVHRKPWRKEESWFKRLS